MRIRDPGSGSRVSGPGFRVSNPKFQAEVLATIELVPPPQVLNVESQNVVEGDERLLPIRFLLPAAIARVAAAVSIQVCVCV